VPHTGLERFQSFMGRACSRDACVAALRNGQPSNPPCIPHRSRSPPPSIGKSLVGTWVKGEARQNFFDYNSPGVG